MGRTTVSERAKPTMHRARRVTVSLDRAEPKSFFLRPFQMWGFLDEDLGPALRSVVKSMELGYPDVAENGDQAFLHPGRWPQLLIVAAAILEGIVSRNAQIFGRKLLAKDPPSEIASQALSERTSVLQRAVVWVAPLPPDFFELTDEKHSHILRETASV